jgi:hypothetical protein
MTFAIENVERCNVVLHGSIIVVPLSTTCRWQQLGTVACTLALLITAQHHSPLGWVHVTNDVGELLLEPGCH